MATASGRSLKRPAISFDDFPVIDPNKCTECVGHHDSSQCAAVCPTEACVPDPDHKESKEELQAKFNKLTGN